MPLKETEGIVEVSIKEEKEHVSVKLAMAQLGGAPQLDLQMAVVNALRKTVRKRSVYDLKHCRRKKK